jgi:hypothetical protein
MMDHRGSASRATHCPPAHFWALGTRRGSCPPLEPQAPPLTWTPTPLRPAAWLGLLGRRVPSGASRPLLGHGSARASPSCGPSRPLFTLPPPSTRLLSVLYFHAVLSGAALQHPHLRCHRSTPSPSLLAPGGTLTHARRRDTSCPTRAPPGPSGSCPTWAPPARAGRGDDGCRPGARHGAEMERFEVAPPARAGAVGRAPPVQAVRACWQTPERNWPSLDTHRPLFDERTWNGLPSLQRTPPRRCRCRSRSWVRHFSKGACDSRGA